MGSFSRASHIAHETFVEHLRQRTDKQRKGCMECGTPIVWKPYFCLVKIKEINGNNHRIWRYPDLQSARRTVPHSDDFHRQHLVSFWMFYRWILILQCHFVNNLTPLTLVTLLMKSIDHFLNALNNLNYMIWSEILIFQRNHQKWWLLG